MNVPFSIYVLVAGSEIKTPITKASFWRAAAASCTFVRHHPAYNSTFLKHDLVTAVAPSSNLHLSKTASTGFRPRLAYLVECMWLGM